MNKYVEDQAIFEELINVTAEKLGLAEACVVEKDFYVAQANDFCENSQKSLIWLC